MKKIIHQLLVVVSMCVMSSTMHPFDFDIGFEELKISYQGVNLDFAQSLLTTYVELFSALARDPKNVVSPLRIFEESIFNIDTDNLHAHQELVFSIIETVHEKYSEREDQKRIFAQGCTMYTSLRDNELPQLDTMEIALKNEGRFKRWGRSVLKSIGNVMRTIAVRVEHH